MKQITMFLILISFSIFLVSSVKASDVYYQENAVWIQDAGWPRLNKYSLNNLTKVVDDLTKNHIKYAIVMVGYYDANSPTNAVLWQRTTTGGYMDGGPPNVTFYTSVVNALHAANITAIAWIEDTHGPINITPSNWENLMSQINLTLQWGFDGYSDDIERIIGAHQDYINWLNNVTVWLHSLGKLSMPAVGYDWRMDTNPYLHVDYIVTMFYGAASLFDPSNPYSKDVEAYWQENFGMYGGQNNPPASPVILGIMNFYGNTYPLAWQLDRAGYLIKKYGAPQLKGFSIWLYEYMGTNPTDWSQWNYWITHVNETYSPPLSILNITTSPMSDVPMMFEGTNMYKLPFEPFYSPKSEYLFNGTVSITAPSQAVQETHYVLFGDSDHTGGKMGYSVYTYAGGPYNLTSSAEVSSLYFYCKATGNVKVAIYNATSYHISGWIGTDYHPYALMTKSNPTSCAENSWVLINVSPVTLQPGIYFIAIKGDTTGIIGASGKKPEPVGGDIHGYNQFITESYTTDFKQIFPTVEGAMGGEPSAYVPTAQMILTNYNFSHWENGEISLTHHVDVSGNMTLTAYYTQSGPILGKVFGNLVDRFSDPIQAKVIIYQEGTNNVIAQNQTDLNGNYNLHVFPGIYDLQFNLTNFFIKILSVNVSEDILNPIKQINLEENKLSISIESNYSKKIQVFSDRKPIRVKLNGTVVPSWSYDEANKILTINVSVITAKSGYWKDIQQAVDLVASLGGGSVYIPEGNFNWTANSFNQSFDSRPTGVIIPGGVNIIGAGADKTILNVTERAPTNALIFGVYGRNEKPVRISGIHFIGYVKNETENIGGIRLRDVKDFRVDHCYFENFDNAGVSSRKQEAEYIHRGVIDHNTFDNPYKDTVGGIWGYGIICTSYYGIDPWSLFPLESLLGTYGDNVVFIEDNNFSRTRHAIASNEGGYYVARHNVFMEPRPKNFGIIDIHGSCGVGYPGGIGLEAYNNTIIGASNYTASQAFWIRGGGGVIFNNTMKNILYGIGLYNESKVHELYIWNNTMEEGKLINNYADYSEGVDYFLYPKPNYKPCPYPHPLTQE